MMQQIGDEIVTIQVDKETAFFIYDILGDRLAIFNDMRENMIQMNKDFLTNEAKMRKAHTAVGYAIKETQ